MDLSYILNSPDVERIASALEMLADNSGKSVFTDGMKIALLNIFQHVAYTDDQGQAYYDALYAALYGGIVPVTTREWIYHFDNSLRSDGSMDFGLTSPSAAVYDSGKFGMGVKTTPETASGVPRAANMSSANIPQLDGDFTIALWFKIIASSPSTGSTVALYRNSLRKSTTEYINISLPDNWYNGYTNSIDYDTLRKNNIGVSLAAIYDSGWTIWCSFVDAGETKIYLVRPNVESMGILRDTWYHLAMCRTNGIITYYLNGRKVCSFRFAGTLYTPDFVSIGGRQANVGDFENLTVENGADCVVDELYINDEKCLYTDEFTPPDTPYHTNM